MLSSREKGRKGCATRRDDPNTGTSEQCSELGGTWFNPDYFNGPSGDWSDQPDAGLAYAASLSEQADSGSCPSGTICSNAWDDNGKNWFMSSPAFDTSSATNVDYIKAISRATAPLDKLINCAYNASVSNFVPFGDKLVGEGPKTAKALDKAKSGADVVDNVGKVAKHSEAIARTLEQIELPNIAGAVAEYGPIATAAAEDLAPPILAINAAHAAAQTYVCVSGH